MKIWRLSCHWKLHFIIWIFLFEIVLLNATKCDHYLALILVAAQFCGWLMEISPTSPERWFLHTNSDILSTNQSHCEVCMVDALLNRRMMHLTFTGPNIPLSTALALTQDVCMHAPMHLFCMWAHNCCPTLTQAVYLLQGTVTPPPPEWVGLTTTERVRWNDNWRKVSEIELELLCCGWPNFFAWAAV